MTPSKAPDKTSGDNVPKLLIWQSAGAGRPASAALLSGLSGGSQSEAHISFNSLEEFAGAAGATPDAKLLLVAGSAENEVARAIEQGTPPISALSQWQQEVREILALQRRNRSRTIVLDANSVQHFPDRAAAAIGLQAPPHVPAEEATQKDGPDPIDPTCILLARLCLKEDPSAQRLAEELSAAMLDLGGGKSPPTFDADGLFSLYLESRQRAEKGWQARIEALEQETAASHLALQSEIQALNLRLSESAAELEEFRQKYDETAQALDSERAARAELETELGELHAALSERVASLNQLKDVLAKRETELAEARKAHEAERLLEREKLDILQKELSEAHAEKDRTVYLLEQRLKQLNQGLEVLQDQIRDLRDKEAVLAEVQAELARSREEIERIFNSRSMRLTAPLRKIGDLLRRVRANG